MMILLFLGSWRSTLIITRPARGVSLELGVLPPRKLGSFRFAKGFFSAIECSYCARAGIRGGARGRFYIVVDLVNRLESESRASRQERLADYLTRLDFIVLVQTGGQLLFHLISRLYERTSVTAE
jgi:hypothetical protein